MPVQSPVQVLRWKRRVNEIAAAVAELLFSCVREYVRTFGEMRWSRHRFVAMRFAAATSSWARVTRGA